MIALLPLPSTSLSDISYSTKEKISRIIQGIAIPLFFSLGTTLNLAAAGLFFGVITFSAVPVSVMAITGLIFTALGVYLTCNVIRNLGLFEKQVHDKVEPLIDYITQINQSKERESETLQRSKKDIEAYWTANQSSVIESLKRNFPIRDRNAEVFDTFMDLQKLGMSYQKLGHHYYCFLNIKLSDFFEEDDDEKIGGGEKEIHFALSENGLVIITETKKKEKFTHIPEDALSLLSKAAAANTLNGGLLPIYDVEVAKGTQYVVQKLCNRGDLLASEPYFGKENRKQAKNITKGILSALKALHEKRMIHHDIRLENIFLDRDLHSLAVFLGDYDLLHKEPVEQKSEILRILYEKKREACGDTRYRAPEFFLEGQFDFFKQDVWSVGIVLSFLFVPSYKVWKEFLGNIDKLPINKWKKNSPTHKEVTDFYEKCFKWSVIKDEKVKEFLQKLLKINPEERCTAEMACHFFEEAVEN